MKNIYGVDGLTIDSIESLEYIFGKYGFSDEIIEDYFGKIKFDRGGFTQSIYEKILELNGRVGIEQEDIDAAILFKLCKNETKFSADDFAAYFKFISAQNSGKKQFYKLDYLKVASLKKSVEALEKNAREEERAGDDADSRYTNSGERSASALAERDEHYWKQAAYEDESRFVKGLINGTPRFKSINQLVRGFSNGKGYFDEIRTLLDGEYEVQSFFDKIDGKENNRDDR